MAPGWARKLVALVAAGVVLLIVGWLDTVVLVGIQRRSEETFDISQVAWALPLGYLAVAAALLAIGLLARWVNSAFVGLAYALVGAFLTFLFPIEWQWAAAINGAAPFLPGPIASFVNEAYLRTEQGPLNAVAIIGAGMLLVGLANIGLALRRERPAAGDAPDGQSEPVASTT
jgi:hypothetical protein